MSTRDIFHQIHELRYTNVDPLVAGMWAIVGSWAL